MTEEELNTRYDFCRIKFPNISPNILADAIHSKPFGRDEVVTGPINPGLAVGITYEDLRPMSSAPKDGTYIILFGDSGYTTTPLRCQVCHYDPEYRPLDPWQTFSNDSFEDSGTPPIGWIELPTRPVLPVVLKDGWRREVGSALRERMDKVATAPEDVPTPSPVAEYHIFTFMSDSPHRNRYRKIYGSFVEARSKMFGLHDGAWCMQYGAIQGEKIIKNFHLKELL